MGYSMNDSRKAYYSISEVCRSTGLEPHVLRYWESEFTHLRPRKNRAGNRAYRPKDIELIEFIKRLLYEEQYTIPGARKKLAAFKATDALAGGNGEGSEDIRKETIEGLRDVLKVLTS